MINDNDISAKQSQTSIETLNGFKANPDVHFNKTPEGYSGNQKAPKDPSEVNAEDWISIIKQKANQSEIAQLQKQKANKHDSEQQMRALDIMHRQMTHLSVLLLEVQKQMLNEQNETTAQLKSRRMFTLEQMVNVTNWIHDFNPQNVNFMDLNLPGNLRTLDDYSRVALKEYPKQNRVVMGMQRNSTSIDVSESQVANKDNLFNVQIKSVTASNASRRRERGLTGSYQDGSLTERYAGPTMLDQVLLNSQNSGADGLIGSPRASRNFGGPINVSTNKSGQMDRFLKSSIPQARRGGLNLINRTFDKPQ